MSADAGACPSCGAAGGAGTGPCPACGAVTGEHNHCPACQAYAGVREVEGGRYLCMACAAPRPRLARTHVAEHLGTALATRAGRARTVSRFAYGGAALIALGGAGLAGLLRALGLGTGAAVAALLAAGVSVGAYLFGRGRARAAREAGEAALEAHLLSLAAGGDGGVTAEGAARATARLPAEVDGVLTVLAKRGRVEMDVDDEGTIRYRVAPQDALADDAALGGPDATGRAGRFGGAG